MVQCGNDRKPTFRDDSDRVVYLRALQEMAQRYACDIHAYVLMSNHVHLLVTPEVGAGLSASAHLKLAASLRRRLPLPEQFAKALVAGHFPVDQRDRDEPGAQEFVV